MSIDTFLLSADTTDLDYPEVRPTLDLNFARVKALDPRITFTRASGGSYVGADGLIKYAGVNEARFDHDPVTGESLGLLIEESRSNIFTLSEDFSTWGKPSGTQIITNVITAPDGTLTADKIVEDNTLSQHYVFRTPSVTSGTTYTVSGYVKAAERTEVFLNFSSFNGAFTSNSFAYFNILRGNFRLIGSSVTNYGFESLPNGWYRVWITAAAIATVAVPIISPFHISNGAANFYVGDGTSGIYVWGAQLEEGSFPTSYIPTQGSTRTRAADDASITGRNFSEWYRQDEGSIYCIGRTSSGLEPTILTFSNSSTKSPTDMMRYTYVFSTTRWLGLVSLNAIFELFPSQTFSSGSVFKISGCYKLNDFANVLNGGQVVSDTAGAVPSVNRLYLGDNSGYANYLNGTISRLTYYPKRLPNQQLQALTR
jgi:hypothetical protein